MASLLISIIIFAAVMWTFVLVLEFKSATIVGKVGERFVSKKLFSELDPQHYRVLNDFMLPSNGKLATTQIDHVVVSNYGVFVIETKSLNGWIFGDAYQKQWTQTFYRHKQRFYNPLHQNYGHVKAIESVVAPHYPNLPIIGFVAFPSAGKLQISNTNSVGQARDILKKIQSYTSEAISDSERKDVVDILSAYNIRDGKLRKQHAKGVKRIKNSKAF